MTASRQVSAPGQLVTSASVSGAAASEPRRRDRRVERMDIRALDPPQEQVLFGRDAHCAVAVRLGESLRGCATASTSDRRAPSSRSRARSRIGSDVYVGGRPVQELARKDGQLRHDARVNSGTGRVLCVTRARRLSIDGGLRRGNAARSSTGGCSGSNGSGAPPSALNRSSSSWNSARNRSQPIASDQELHPVALLVLVVAEPVKDPQHGFSDVEDLRSWNEVVEDRPGLAEDRCRRR